MIVRVSGFFGPKRGQAAQGNRAYPRGRAVEWPPLGIIPIIWRPRPRFYAAFGPFWASGSLRRGPGPIPWHAWPRLSPCRACLRVGRGRLESRSPVPALIRMDPSPPHT